MRHQLTASEVGDYTDIIRLVYPEVADEIDAATTLRGSDGKAAYGVAMGFSLRVDGANQHSQSCIILKSGRDITATAFTLMHEWLHVRSHYLHPDGYYAMGDGCEHARILEDQLAGHCCLKSRDLLTTEQEKELGILKKKLHNALIDCDFENFPQGPEGLVIVPSDYEVPSVPNCPEPACPQDG